VISIATDAMAQARQQYVSQERELAMPVDLNQVTSSITTHFLTCRSRFEDRSLMRWPKALTVGSSNVAAAEGARGDMGDA
jgi:hypothetical protein